MLHAVSALDRNFLAAPQGAGVGHMEVQFAAPLQQNAEGCALVHPLVFIVAVVDRTLQLPHRLGLIEKRIVCGVFKEHEHIRMYEPDVVDRVHMPDHRALSGVRRIKGLKEGAPREITHLIAVADNHNVLAEHLSPVPAVGHIGEGVIARLIRKEIYLRDKAAVILLHHET